MDDGVFCNGDESCNEANAQCVSSGDPCADDGLFCNGDESCDEEADSCESSGDPCDVIEECLEDTDECVERGDDDDNDDTDDDDEKYVIEDGEDLLEALDEGEISGGCCGDSCSTV